MLLGLATLATIFIFGFLALRAGGGVGGGWLDVCGWLDDFFGTRSRAFPGPLKRWRARREQRQREADFRRQLVADREKDPRGFDRGYGKAWLEDHLGKRWVRQNFGTGYLPFPLPAKLPAFPVKKATRVPKPYDGPGWFEILTFLRRASVAFTGVFIFGAIMFFIHGFEAEEYDIVSPLGVDWGEIADTPMFTGDVQPSWMLTEEEREADDAESANFRTPYLGSAL